MPLPTRKPSSLTLQPTSTTHEPSSSSSSSPHCHRHTYPHDSRKSMESTGDSGYASSSSWLSPHPDWALLCTYENWKIADAATQRLFVDLRLLADCEVQRRAAKQRTDEALRNSKPNRKPSLLQIPFKRKSLKAGDPPPAPLASSTADSSSVTYPAVEELDAQLDALNKRVAATQPAAERLDSYFDELRTVLGDGRPVSWRSSVSSSGHGHTYVDEYTKARRTVAARDQAYMDSKATTSALQHARLAIQSAHHHYLKAMDLLDAVCSPKKNRWEAMMGDEQSRQETYREAAEWAQKAQICFNECVKALQPHRDLLKREEAQHCEDLQETGLLQAVQLYNLMYGGKILAMGITQQVQIMVQKQDAVFARLTSFAVWVQNCARSCETVELDARESRDAARRQLVALWVRADEENDGCSLLTPSEHSQDFAPH